MLPKVVIKSDFHDYLEGKEVEAAFVSNHPDQVWPGEHVLAFKDSVAATSDIPVPTSQLSHTIGIEGTVTQVVHSKLPEQENVIHPIIKVVKR
jgi:archaeosine-15-forming tRNA-guanine transglycosylase